jgi:hypothetical protein
MKLKHESRNSHDAKRGLCLVLSEVANHMNKQVLTFSIIHSFLNVCYMIIAEESHA